MEKTTIAQPVYAGIIERIAARVAARLLVMIIFVVFVVILVLLSGADGSKADNGVWVGLLLFGIAILAINLVLVIKRAQTLGMYFFGLQVVDIRTGEPLEAWRHILLRGVVGQGLLNIVPLYVLIDLLFIFRSDRRTIHDMIAGSIVVRMDEGYRQQIKPQGYLAPARDVQYEVAKIQQPTKTSGWATALLVVGIAIPVLGILGTIVLLSLGTARDKGVDAMKVSTVATLADVAEFYREDRGVYPPTLMALVEEYNQEAHQPMQLDRISYLDIRYCVFKGGTEAHIGSPLRAASSAALQEDSDFDSSSFGPRCFDGNQETMFDLYLP